MTNEQVNKMNGKNESHSIIKHQMKYLLRNQKSNSKSSDIMPHTLTEESFYSFINDFNVQKRIKRLIVRNNIMPSGL